MTRPDALQAAIESWVDSTTADITSMLDARAVYNGLDVTSEDITQRRANVKSVALSAAVMTIDRLLDAGLLDAGELLRALVEHHGGRS